MGRLELPTGFGPPLHVHAREDELFIIKSGRFEITSGRDRFEVEAGDVVYAPRDVAHTWRCISDETGSFYALITPCGFEQFFARYADLRSNPDLDMQQIVALAGEYGISFVAPQA